MILKYITEIFVGEHFAWSIGIRPDQFIKELSKKNQGSFLGRTFIADGISVQTSGNKFSISKNSEWGASNNHLPFIQLFSFSHILAGSVNNSYSGTRITAHFRLPILTFFISLVWIAIAIYFGFIASGFTLEKGMRGINFDMHSNAWAIFIFPIFAVLFLKLLRNRDSFYEKELIEALRESIDKHKI
ncbi:MAG: hypothetical protein ACXVKO_03095 [Bacteriovorax sp.]